MGSGLKGISRQYLPGEQPGNGPIIAVFDDPLDDAFAAALASYRLGFRLPELGKPMTAYHFCGR
jgi:hypothetical protein